MSATALWVITCALAMDYSGLSCEGISEPVVRVDRKLRGMDGYYEYGSGEIVIAGQLRFWDKEQTLVHEMTHYLYDVSGALEFPVTEWLLCQSEYVAWTLTNEYARTMGYNVNEKWWKFYPECTGEEYYDGNGKRGG